MSTVIKPEPSRHVHFIPQHGDSLAGGVGAVGQPHVAIITHVHSDRMVNLCVFDKNGNPLPKTSVPLVQPGDAEPAAGRYDYCRWMPYTLATETKKKQQEESAKFVEASAAM